MAPTPIPRYKAAVKPKPKPKPAPKRKPVAPKGRGMVQTGGQGTSAAQQIVNASLAPLLASIKQQEEAARAGNQREQDALSGFTKEIISYLQGSPAKINADYQGAIDTTDRLAQTAAEQFRLASPNTEMQSDLSAIGAPEEQKAQLAAQNQSVFGNAAASLYRVGGQIPATMFAADQAANSAFANTLPDIQGLSARQALMKLLGDQREGMQKFTEQRAEIEGKRPGLLQDALESLSGGGKAPTVKRIGNAYYQWGGTDWVKLADYKATDKYGTKTLANGQVVTTVNGQPMGAPWGPVKTKAAGSAKTPTTRNIDGKVKQYNPQTGQWDTIGKAGTGSSSSTVKKLPSVPTIVKNAGNGALELVTDKVWASAISGAKTEEEAQKIYESRLPLSFKSAMTRVIQAISPQLGQMGYRPDDVKVVAYSIVSSKIAPPKGYKAPQPARRNVSQNYTVVTPKTGVVTSKAWKGTHVTDNLGWGSKTAGDIMGKPGTPVGAPESGTIVRHGSAQGGQSMYFQGDSGKIYWLGHIDNMVPAGTRVGVNQQIALISADHANPHVHIDVRGRTV